VEAYNIIDIVREIDRYESATDAILCLIRVLRVFLEGKCCVSEFRRSLARCLRRLGICSVRLRRSQEGMEIVRELESIRHKILTLLPEIGLGMEAKTTKVEREIEEVLKRLEELYRTLYQLQNELRRLIPSLV